MKCTDCPVPEGTDCVVDLRGHRRYCDLADRSGPDYSPPIRADILADSTGTPRVRPVSVLINDPASREVLRETVAVETCLYLLGCHCNNSAACSRPTRPGSLEGEGWKWPDVAWKECYRCVQADEYTPRTVPDNP